MLREICPSTMLKHSIIVIYNNRKHIKLNFRLFVSMDFVILTFTIKPL